MRSSRMRRPMRWRVGHVYLVPLNFARISCRGNSVIELCVALSGHPCWCQETRSQVKAAAIAMPHEPREGRRPNLGPTSWRGIG